jgi:WD40 repeat protein
VELVMANSQLLDLLRRAVMAEFVLEALPEIEAGKPIDLARVYLYAVRHKMERDITTGRTFTSLADKLYFLCELAWEMLSEDKMSINYREFPDRLRVLFKNEVKEQKHLDHWHYDMMGQTMLIRNDDGDYSPAHRSLLEFFVAYKLAAELGLLADDFLEMAQKQSGIDENLEPQFYKWSNYWRRDVDDKGVRELIAPLAGFKQESLEYLRDTFGKIPLTKAILDLLLPALNLEVKYREPNQLLELIKSTKVANVGYLGGNAAAILVRLNSDVLEYQDLNNTNLAHANLVNAGLRGTNLSGANLENCQITRVFGSISAINMSKDNRQFFTAHDDGTIRIWDLYSCQELKKLIGHHKNVNCLVLSPDGKFLYSGGADCKIKEWKLADGNCQHTFEGHQSSINCIALSVDGQFIYSGGQDRTIKEWKLEDKICQRNFNSVPRLTDGVKSIQLTSGVLATILSSNGQYLYSGYDDGIIEEWKLADGKCKRNFVDGNYPISAITLSADGQWLYSGGSSIKEWNLADGSCQRTFRGGHYNSINSILLSDCEQLIYSSSGDATIKEWKLADGTCQRTLTGSPGSLIKPLVMSKDGQMLYSSSSNAVEEYKVIDGTYQRIFESYQDPIGTIALSEDGKFLYSSTKNGSIKEWILTSGTCQRTFREHQTLARTIVLSRDKKWLYSGSDNGLIEKWDLINCICQRTFESHQNSVRAITISENGQLLYFSGGNGMISEWNLVNDICQRTFTGQQQSISTIALSQDGKLLYSGSHNGIEEWKLANGTSRYTAVDCRIFTSNSPALSKDGRLFCYDNLNSLFLDSSAIKEWKLDGSCRNFKSNENWVSAIAISDDNQLLYLGSEDGTIEEWDVETGECLRSIDTRLCAGANITNVKGLTPAQTDSLLALGAFSDD